MKRAGALIAATVAALVVTAPAFAAPTPAVVRDVMTGMDNLGSFGPFTTEPDWVQPDTQIEPSIAVNPANPCNVVTAYQEGRIDSGGDATNGYATSTDCGATWKYGELPGLTTYGQGTAVEQGGYFERASDAVVAFGPDNTVYANSLVFDSSGQSESGGLRSGMAVNVSHNGGLTWGPPVIFQDDQIDGTNDKNWIVVDNSDAPGHHKGRVYVVWDRIAPVVYNYCDDHCDEPSHWLPNFQTVHGVVWPGQGLGAYPVVLKSGGLGMAIGSLTPGIPTRQTDNPDVTNLGHQEFFIAPAAGSTPWPAPLVWTPPVHISDNRSNTVTAQRASDGILSAAVDPNSGTLYTTWEDGRLRSDGKNDVVLSKSTDEGKTWSDPVAISPGPKNDKINRYNTAVTVGQDGIVHVMWRQRDESAAAPLFTDAIDTYYTESSDGGQTWSTPLKVNSQPSMPWYGAFSRGGTFEGDYNQLATAGGYTYLVREQGQSTYDGEPPALTKSGSGLTLATAGRGHQHQRNWVALVRNTVP